MACGSNLSVLSASLFLPLTGIEGPSNYLIGADKKKIPNSWVKITFLVKVETILVPGINLDLASWL